MEKHNIQLKDQQVQCTVQRDLIGLYCIIVSLQGGAKKEEKAEGGDAKSGGVLVANWRKEHSSRLSSSVFWPSDVILNAPFLIFLDELSPAYIVYRL